MLKITVDGDLEECKFDGTVADIVWDMLVAIKNVHAGLKSNGDGKAEIFKKAMKQIVATNPIVQIVTCYCSFQNRFICFQMLPHIP